MVWGKTTLSTSHGRAQCLVATMLLVVHEHVLMSFKSEFQVKENVLM